MNIFNINNNRLLFLLLALIVLVYMLIKINQPITQQSGGDISFLQSVISDFGYSSQNKQSILPNRFGNPANSQSVSSQYKIAAKSLPDQDSIPKSNRKLLTQSWLPSQLWSPTDTPKSTIRRTIPKQKQRQKQKQKQPTSKKTLPTPTIIISDHQCHRNIELSKIFKQLTKLTLFIDLTLHHYDANQQYMLINGSNSTYANPCIIFNSLHPGIIVKSITSKGSTQCQFDHPISPNKTYHYIIVYDNNKLSIIYDGKIVKQDNTYNQEIFDSMKNIYLGPFSKIPTRLDGNISISYLPFAMNIDKYTLK